MKRHFSALWAHSQGISYGRESSARRREFRRHDNFQLKSESQTELHEINVEYNYEVKISDGSMAAKKGDDPSTHELDKEDSSRSKITRDSPSSYKASPCMSPFHSSPFIFPPDYILGWILRQSLEKTLLTFLQ